MRGLGPACTGFLSEDGPSPTWALHGRAGATAGEGAWPLGEAEWGEEVLSSPPSATSAGSVGRALPPASCLLWASARQPEHCPLPGGPRGGSGALGAALLREPHCPPSCPRVGPPAGLVPHVDIRPLQAGMPSFLATHHPAHSPVPPCLSPLLVLLVHGTLLGSLQLPLNPHLHRAWQRCSPEFCSREDRQGLSAPWSAPDTGCSGPGPQ